MRISTTTIESYRLWREPEQDWMAEADLIATIEGRFVSTPQIALGMAFGQVLEQPDRYRVPRGYVCGAYQFDDETMAEPLGLIDRAGVFEAKTVKAYGGGLEVVSKADHVLGAHISEFKTTTKSFDFDKYAKSCQWRFMLDAFEASRVTYHVFLLDDHENGVAELRGIESFNLYPYPALHVDCRTLVHDFADYVRSKGLEALLQARQRAASDLAGVS